MRGRAVQRGIRERIAAQVDVRQIGEQLIELAEGPGAQRRLHPFGEFLGSQPPGDVVLLQQRGGVIPVGVRGTDL